MTEIRVDVDLAHPPERVWSAMTEVHLVTEWLSTNRFLLTEDRRFTFRAAGLKGLNDLIEGHIVASEAPHRLIMQWSSVNLHTTVTVTVRPVAGGTRLTLVQQGFLGPHGAMRRRLLQRSYVELFEGPFTATLDRLAGVRPVSPAAPPVVDGKRNDGRAYERIPRQTRSSSAPGLSSPVRGPAGLSHPLGMPGSGVAAWSAGGSAADAGEGPVAGADPVGATGSAQVRSIGVAPVSPAPVDEGGTPDAGVPSAPEVPAVGGAALAGSAVGGAAVVGSAGGGAAAAGRAAGGSALAGAAGGGSVLAKGGRLAKAGLRRLSAKPTWNDERRSQTVAASTALLLLLAMAALLIGRATSPRPADPPRVGGGTEDTVVATLPAQPDSRASIRRLSPDPGRGSSAALPPAPASALPSVATPSALAAEGLLVATYKTEKTGVSGYEASVTIRNAGRSGASDWTVVITLPLLSLTVPAVTGAVMTQNGKQFTFTPVDTTRTLASSATVQFTFQVSGLGTPDACTINGRSCSGVPG